MLNLEAPDSFFGESVTRTVKFNVGFSDNRDPIVENNPVEKSKSTGSKFSLSSFGSKFKKTATISFEPSTQNVVEDVINNRDLLLKVTEYKGRKSPYIYDSSRGKPVLDENKRRRTNWNDILMKQKAAEISKQTTQREIEKKVAEADVLDFFGSTDKIVIEVKDESSALSRRIDSVMSSLDITEVTDDKTKSSGPGKVTITALFNILFGTLEYMSSEERGRLLLNIIFGGVISRAKYMGNGGKVGSGEFKTIVYALNKLRIGGAGNVGSQIYIKTLDLVTSSKLASYRSTATAVSQARAVLAFIDKISTSSLDVFFPFNISFSDPVPVYITEGGKQVLVTKSVPLSGTPTIENLNSFFSIQTTQNKPKTLKKKINDSEYNDYLDQEDSMLEKGHKGKGDEW